MASIANAGNGGSLEKCRRRWDLADAEFLKYKFMNAFDRAMNHLDKAYSFSDNEHTYVSRKVRRPVENSLFTPWLWSNSCRVFPRCMMAYAASSPCSHLATSVLWSASKHNVCAVLCCASMTLLRSSSATI